MDVNELEKLSYSRNKTQIKKKNTAFIVVLHFTVGPSIMSITYTLKRL
jgi:hypothetical protein